MKYLIVLILIFTSNLSYSYENNQLLLHNNPKKVGSIELQNLQNENKDIFKEIGVKKIYLLNFWATWCPPCIKEIPELLDLKNNFKKDIEVIFISVDSNPKKVIPKFIKKNKFNEIIIFVDSKLDLSEKLDVTKMPTTLILNAKLEEIARIEGYIDWTDREIINEFKKLL